MRMAVGLEDGLGLDGDRCIKRDTPTAGICVIARFAYYGEDFTYFT